MKTHRFIMILLAVFILEKVTCIAQCSFTYNLGADTSFCTGSNFTLTITAPSGLAPYLWDNGSTLQSRTVTALGNYYCRASQLGQDLVVNGNFDLGNNGFVSNYVVGTGGTWGPISNPGTYLVTSNSSLAHSNFTSFNDHSGSGNMMVVNGASTANTSVWCQSILVSPNTDYNFSAWVTSCESGQPASQLAQLQFSINGTAIGNVFSPTAVAPGWTNFSSTWNSGSNANAVICIVNQNTAAAANDFALDDIFFQPVCTFTDTLKVIAKPLPSLVNAGIDTTVCDGESVFLSANQGTGTTFSWSSIPAGFSSTSLQPEVSPSIATNYILTAELNGCIKRDTVTVLVNSLPQADFTVSIKDSSCKAFEIFLLNSSLQSSSYLWNLGDGTISTDTSISHNYGVSGTYTLTLIAFDNGCKDTVSRLLNVQFSSAEFVLPNVITPNDDLSNDRFYVPGECLASVSVSIFNRWGKLVKKWDNLDGFWDGKIKGNPAAEGVYYYVMEGSYANGETTRLNGTISLYR